MEESSKTETIESPRGERSYSTNNGEGSNRSYSHSSQSRKFVYKKKECYFTRGNSKEIDYKDAELLKRFVSKNGKILPRRFTGTSPKFQRKLAIAIKRARYIALLPFFGEVRGYSSRHVSAEAASDGGYSNV